MIDKITFKNFKIFKNWQTLKLKPITILIGKNNSGKSAIAKLPTMIAGGLSGEFSSPLNWVNKVGNDSNKVELGNSFEDLVYNRNAITSLALNIGNSNDKSILEVVVSKAGILSYKQNGKELDVEKMNFKGLLVDGKKIDHLNLKIDYIGAFRVIPDSSFSLENENYTHIGVNGKNAYQILIQDFVSEQELIDKISSWYAANFEGWKIEVLKIGAKTGTQFQIVISNNNVDLINIVNVGQGIHQALPLIVRSFMPVKEETLIIIEEPETHLHPTAHGNLAQRFAESYLENQNRHYLIETHSQNFVLRLRRLIAEKKLNKKDLAIYYIDFEEEKNESHLEEIKVNELGEVDWWPEGVFNETSKEVRSIYNAKLNSLKDVD